MITINNYKDLFEDIKTAHYQLNSYGFGPEWKINELMNKGITYPCLYIIPIGSITLDQVQHRRFEILVFDKVDVVDTLNESNIEVLSDAEQILNDIIKILKKETDNYDLVNEPDLEPFQAEYKDVVTGYKAEVVIASELNSNYCDIPASSFVSPGGNTTSVTITNAATGQVIATITGGGNYNVTVLSGINDTLTANVTTIVDNII